MKGHEALEIHWLSNQREIGEKGLREEMNYVIFKQDNRPQTNKAMWLNSKK